MFCTNFIEKSYLNCVWQCCVDAFVWFLPCVVACAFGGALCCVLCCVLCCALACAMCCALGCAMGSDESCVPRLCVHWPVPWAVSCIVSWVVPCVVSWAVF